MLGDDDDGWGRRGFGVYPTLINREGPDVGRAQENGMARGVTWPNGCQTVEFQNHDGSITSYRTHGGMPQVTTNEIVVEAPVCIIEELTSPLTETSYAARTYHADERLFSMNGMYSIPLKPINRITVTTGDIVPQTRAICLAQNDSTTGVRVNDTDLVETSRTYSLASYFQRVYINGTFIPCGFDARLTDIALAGKCGRPLTLKVYPTGGVAGTHGSVFGDHVLGSATITSYRVMGLNAKTNVTLKKFEIVLSSPGKFFERIENAAWTVLNNLTTPAPNAPFPWERRLLKFAGLKCFQRVNGNLYTDQTLTTLLDASLRPASFVADTEFGPRYFKFTANADYTLPATNWKFPGDAIFPRKMFCFPEAVYSARVNPFRLLPSEHIFKCAAGQVWKIGVTLTTGAGATDNYKIYLRNRFDPILESVSTVNLLLAEVNAKNWSAYPGYPLGAPSGGPTARPTSMAFVSKPEGSEAYLIGYWEDLFLFPTSERKRKLTSVLKVSFTETGSSNPTTGVGISAAVVEEEVFKDMEGTDTSHNSNTSATETVSDVTEDIGECGVTTLHARTRVTTLHPAIIDQGSAGSQTYKQLLWIYVSTAGVFDLVYYVPSVVYASSASGYASSGAYTDTWVDYCVDPAFPPVTGTTRTASGSYSTLKSSTSNQTWSVSILSTVRGVLFEINVQGTLTSETHEASHYTLSGWVVDSSYVSHTHSGTLDGVPWSASILRSAVPYSHTNVGTHYMLNAPTPIAFENTDVSIISPELSVVSGAAYHYVRISLHYEIDGVFDSGGLTPFVKDSADKIYHGYVFPRDTQIQRVSIDPRAGVAHIAAADADAGHFY